MGIFKVISATIKALGESVQQIAELINIATGEEGLKATTRGTFKLVNNSIDQSVFMAEVEAKEELKEFMKAHGITATDMKKLTTK